MPWDRPRAMMLKIGRRLIAPRYWPGGRFRSDQSASLVHRQEIYTNLPTCLLT